MNREEVLKVIEEAVSGESDILDEEGEPTGETEVYCVTDDARRLLGALEDLDDDDADWGLILDRFNEVWGKSGPVLRFQHEAVRQMAHEVEVWALAYDVPEWALPYPNDEQFEAFAAALRKRFPAMPKGEEHYIADQFLGERGAMKKIEEMEDPALAAVVAWVRHNYTAYDSIRRGGGFEADDYGSASSVARDEARKAVGVEIRDILRSWEGQG